MFSNHDSSVLAIQNGIAINPVVNCQKGQTAMFTGVNMDVLTMVISKMANCISSSGLSRKGLKVILLYCTNNEKEESITVAFCNVLTLNLFC